MRWPFKRKSSGDQWVVSWSGQVLCYVAARATAPGKWDVVKMGVEVQGEDSMELFVQRLQTLGLKGANAVVMLRPEQYQLLQIDTPPVAPEELKSAARYQIRDLLDVHIDDVTLDIMKVGDGQQKGTEHLFVVAATNAVIRQPMELATAMDWDVSVIDIQENAQRNLQTAVARAAGSAARAQALLVISDERQAVLTISANEELFYTRRLDLPKGFMDMTWEQADAPAVDDGFTPVQEYVPDYNGGGASYGTDYSAAAPAGGGNEQAQRVLVEVQRSLDLWDRTWSALPLAGLQVMAGDRSAELATWLGREMGQTVGVLELSGLFGGLDVTAPNQRAVCAPLLGVLLRTEARKL
jgi:MSHA biogenesis protein MshI